MYRHTFCRINTCILILVALACVATAASARAATALRHDDVIWLQRVTAGIDASSVERYQQLGRQRYLDDQLTGAHDTLPPAISAMLASFDVLNTPPAQLLATYRDQQRQYKNMPEGASKDVAKKTLQTYRRNLYQQDAQTVMLHAIYGGNPLKEQMVAFWLNHFSVYAQKGRVRLLAADYVEHDIRPHALGRFRDLLMATLKSPAMLEYLDNAKNVKGQTNENYARELLELHTLGVGSGYTQQDVQQLALILSGAGFELRDNPRRRRQQRDESGVIRDGLFVFDPARHDFSDKALLGHTIKGSGYGEIEQAITLITRQPACARFISHQLARYFLSDQPPPALVAAMAQTFQRTDGDVAAVLRTLFTSPAMASGTQRKFKDPLRFVVSAMRLAQSDQPISNGAPLVNWMNRMGQPVFGRITPDGWPLDDASWTSSGQMAGRFEVARAIGSGRNRLFTATDDGAKPRGEPPSLDSALYRSAMAPYLSAATRSALQQAATPAEWNSFLLSSPDFNYR